MGVSLPDIAGLTLTDLKGLVSQLFKDVAVLKAENTALWEEIARLKGLKGPPKLRPSGDGEVERSGAQERPEGPPSGS